MDVRTRSLLLALGVDPEAPVATALSTARARAGAPGEVTRPEGFDLRGRATPGGLSCEAVFGPIGSPERGTRCGHVALPVAVGHPLLAEALLETLVVLPPDLRPAAAPPDEGDPADDAAARPADPNPHYRQVVNRCARLRRLLTLRAPPPIVQHESAMLEDAVRRLFLAALLPLAGLAPGSVVAGEPLPPVGGADAALREALAALDTEPLDPVAVGRAVELALRCLPPETLDEELLHHRLDEAVPSASRRRAVRPALADALFERLSAEHPAWPRLARGAVDRLTTAGRLAEALRCASASGDDPLRVGVLEAALCRGTDRLEGVAADGDARGWTARVALAVHHLRGRRIPEALAWLTRAAETDEPHLFQRPVRPPPLPDPGEGSDAGRIVGELQSCLGLNGLLNCATLAGLLRLSRVVPAADAEALRAHALAWTRRVAASRTERACDEVRDLARYLTSNDAHAEAVAAFEAGLDGWPPGYDRDLLENGLALALGRVGRHAEAIALLQGLFARATAAGSADAGTLGLNLGTALLEARRADEAVALYAGLVGGPAGADAASGLAWAHLQRGDAAAARDAVAPVWRAWPQEAVATAAGVRVAEPLLTALLALGDAEAVAVQTRLLDASRARQREGPSTWLEEANLGSVLVRLGRHEEALPWLLRALHQQQGAFGENATDALRTRRTLIGALRGLGRDAEADALEAPLAALEADAVSFAPFDPLGILRG